MTKEIKEQIQNELLILIKRELEIMDEYDVDETERSVENYCNLVATYLKVDSRRTEEDKQNDTKQKVNHIRRK